MAKTNKVLFNIDQRSDTTASEKETARNNIGAAPANILDKSYTWKNTTPQWSAPEQGDATVRLWYCKNYAVNRATIELNENHTSLCYVRATLPELTENEMYHLSFEIAISSVGVNAGTHKAILVIDSEDQNFSMLCEFATDGTGGFINTPMNRMTLPDDGFTVRYKVYVDGHAYRVSRLA